MEVPLTTDPISLMVPALLETHSLVVPRLLWLRETMGFTQAADFLACSCSQPYHVTSRLGAGLTSVCWSAC